MTIDRNDPRLTAFVLNELEDREKAEVEAALQSSDELRSEIEKIREACAQLTGALGQEPTVGLRPEQIEEIERAVGPQTRTSTRPWWWRPGLPIAASVLLAAVLFGPGWVERLQPAKQVALQQREAVVGGIREAAGQEVDSLSKAESALKKNKQALADASEVFEQNRQLPDGRKESSGSDVEPAVSSNEPQSGQRSNHARADQDAEKVQRRLGPEMEEGRSSQVKDGFAVSLQTGTDTKQMAEGKAGDQFRDATDPAGPAPAAPALEPPLEAKVTNFEARLSGRRQAESTDARLREEDLQGAGDTIGRSKIVSGAEADTERTRGVSTRNVVDQLEEPTFADKGAGLDEATRSEGELRAGAAGLPGSAPAPVGGQGRGELARRDLGQAQVAGNVRVTGQKTDYEVSVARRAPVPTAEGEAGEYYGNEPREEAAVRGYHFGDRYWHRHPYPDPDPHPQPKPDLNTESYDRIVENPFVRVENDPRSTFSIDVDTASYANVRRFLTQGTRPPRDAVRIEELINYFSYDYPQPGGGQPFSISLEVAAAPWHPQHRLVRVGLKGREIREGKRPSSNLVFLIDVSGSMRPANKLPLLKESMRLLVDRLTENDTVAMVVYAGASGLVLPPTTGDRKSTIRHALENLHAGGSTNGGAGIELAYKCAVDSFIRGGVNRVILATDGDFNVGVTNQGDLVRLIERKRQSGVFLSVLGFGMGNLKDANLEKLADKGNGNYSYIDSDREARKVLVEQMNSTLVTIARDVKIQIEFNPARVQAYRLIGYENRVMAHQDFNDDRKDAGEIGAGHTVTALYEVVPSGIDMNGPGVDPLRYQPATQPENAGSDRMGEPPHGNELMFVRLRYKKPDGGASRLVERPLPDANQSFAAASPDFRFAAAVASFGMLLRDSAYRGDASFDQVLNWALAGRGEDAHGHRQDFLRLVIQAQGLD